MVQKLTIEWNVLCVENQNILTKNCWYRDRHLRIVSHQRSQELLNNNTNRGMRSKI